MSRSDDSGEFTAEVVRRLKELRVQAGLTQTELAQRMGLKPGGGQQTVSRFELGKSGSPGFRFVLDYLRACGASLSDIAGILDRYTSRPTVLELEAEQTVVDMTKDLPNRIKWKTLHYDVRVRVRRRFDGGKPVPVEKHVEMVMNQALACYWHQRLNEQMYEVLSEFRIGCRSWQAIGLLPYGRKIFGILRRTRKKKGKWRQKQLAEADKWPRKYGLPEDAAQRTKQAVIELVKEMEESGELDRLPADLLSS